MNVLHFVYNFFSSCLVPMVLPVVWCHERRDPERKKALVQRLGGGVPPASSADRAEPVIWIHAVSVGEVKAALAIVRELEKTFFQGAFVLTTTTVTGQRFARRQVGNSVDIRYAPVDLWWPTARFLAAQRPSLLVCMETEIWPNWIAKAHRLGIKTVFINGRISGRSIRSYRLIRPLIAPLLKKVAAFSMISDSDARRMIDLGAPPERVQVNGNAKIDALDAAADRRMRQALKETYAVDDGIPVFIAGSIRGVESEIVMDAYRRLAALVPGLVFIVAPRHIENAARIAAYAQAKRIPWQYRTDLGKGPAKRSAPVVIINTIGELRDVYSLATVVFCGGSLVPLGGQNVLEPALWGKPVLFGPSMEDFQEARDLLETAGGGLCVGDGASLAEQAGKLFLDPVRARKMGRRAKQAVLANQGAARRHAAVISELLDLTRGR